MQQLINNGLTFSRHYDIDIIKNIKEKKTYIAQDYEQEVQEFADSGNAKDTLYELPDGSNINIGVQQIDCSEALFHPEMIGKNIVGIHELIYRSYFSIDMEVRKTLFSKIVQAGGNTMFMNIAERLCKEMKVLGSSSITFKIFVPAERMFTVWIGGSVISSLSTFQTMWISKKEYEEIGSRAVHMKCM